MLCCILGLQAVVILPRIVWNWDSCIRKRSHPSAQESVFTWNDNTQSKLSEHIFLLFPSESMYQKPEIGKT